MLTVTFIVIMVLIFTQFGGRLAASQALLWWTIFLFLTIASIAPEILRPVAHFLGIELVSNLILGGMIMMGLFQIIEHSAVVTHLTRQHRLGVANSAALKFVEHRNHAIESGQNLSALVVLPSYNEEGALPAVISQIEDLVRRENTGIKLDFCFVDDGSKDATAKILRTACPKNFTSHAVNIGVSGVLLTGFKIARDLGFSYVVQCDGDGQHPIGSIADIVRHAHSAKADLMVGSRHSSVVLKGSDLNVSKDQSSTPIRMLGAKLLILTMRVFGRGAVVSDPTSGFRVYSMNAVSVLLDSMPDEYPEPESVIIVKLAGLEIGEVRVSMQPRSTGISSLSGLKSTRYMIKVCSALVGLRLRSLISR